MVVVVPQVHEQKPCDGSFVRIPSEKLAQMARQSLENIERYKARDIQRLVDELREKIVKGREKRRNSFWSKIFGYKEKPMPSDEAILEAYKNQGDGMHLWFPETLFIEMRYQKNIDVAYRLLNASKHADEVAVSTKDLERLL